MRKTRKGLSAADRLLVLLNLARPSEAERAETALLARGPALDWAALGALAEFNAVLPLSLARLEAEGLDSRVPREVLEPWRAKAAALRDQGARRRGWSMRMLRAMHEAGVEVIVLKGSLFAEAVYGDPDYKKMNDVDILIRREDAGRAVAVLTATGFRSVGALFGKDELSSKSHHAPPYVSPDLACVIGLHWGLCSPLAPWRPDMAGIWKRKSAIAVAGAPAFRMSWEDNLLHLCIHLPFFKTGLRELADVFNVARASNIDWQRLGTLARRWKAEDAAYRVLSLADALAPLGIPKRLLRQWRTRASGMAVADTDARLSRPASILRSRSTQVAKIEKAFAVFLLSRKDSERVGAWAKAYSLLLWPKEEELVRIMGASGLERPAERIAARLQAPLRIWSAMARDSGHLSLAAATAASLAAVTRAGARWAIGRSTDGPSLREHPAAPLLEVLE